LAMIDVFALNPICSSAVSILILEKHMR
jgi:hypothetical protein